MLAPGFCVTRSYCAQLAIAFGVPSKETTAAGACWRSAAGLAAQLATTMRTDDLSRASSSFSIYECSPITAATHAPSLFAHLMPSPAAEPDRKRDVEGKRGEERES